MTRSVALAALMTFGLHAQSTSLPSGSFHFVQIGIREDGKGKRIVRSGGGTLSLDGKGALRIKGRIGANREAVAPIERSATYTVAGTSLLIPSPLDPAVQLQVRAGETGTVLIGSTAGDARSYDLLVAARAPEGTPPDMAGKYAGGFLTLINGEGRGLASGYAELSSNGQDQFSSVKAIGHTAGIDDVNRIEEAKAVPFGMAAGGVGKANFRDLDDTMFSGEKELLLSADGQVLLAFGTGTGRREIAVLLKRPAEQAPWFLAGQYWLAEVGAETAFKYQPEAARFTAASGVFQSGGEGRGVIDQGVRMGGEFTRLRTVNPYRIGSDGKNGLAPRLTQRTENLALGEMGGIFSGAQVGPVGELTLDHGIFVGIRFAKTPPQPAGIALGVPRHLDGSPISSAKPARTGMTVAIIVGGSTPGKSPSKVWFGGKPAKISYEGALPGVIDLYVVHAVVPGDLAKGRVPVVIESGDLVTDVADVLIAPSP